MKVVILSDDTFLVEGIKYINISGKYISMNDIKDYITDFSNEKKIVFVDDRIKSINILSLNNCSRSNDVLVRLCFNKDKKLDFFEHSIILKNNAIDFKKTIMSITHTVNKSNPKVKGKELHLTRREAQVLSLYLSGMNTKWICSYLSLNEKTVSNYKVNIIKKYRCSGFLHFCRTFISG